MRTLRSKRVAVAVVACVGSMLPGSVGAARSSTVRDALSPLRVSRDPSPAITDAADRQVLLRGVNDNQLGDYYQVDPTLPPTIPLVEDEFASMASLGFNVVRLIVHWSLLEPQRGVIDRAYVSRIRHAVEWAGRHGIYVVLDMHQDAWGKYVATPPSETCVPGFDRAVGWDGAPQWATVLDEMPTCRLQQREFSPAVAQAFQNLWIDRDGIQTELVGAWAALAREFAADPVIAGYDLLNEPNPGWTVGVTDVSLLGLFYARTITAIREAESSVPGGFPHIVFFEPIITWDLAAVGVSPHPGFTDDPNIVFAPHLYVGSLSIDHALGVDVLSIAGEFDEAAREADRYGTTFWSGEWGWFGDPSADATFLREYAVQEDAHFVGGAWWQWRQACGDPHNLSGGEPAQWVSPGLNRYACTKTSVTPLGIPREFGSILSRAFPRAAPGRLIGLSSDGQSGELRLRAVTTKPGWLDVWVPGSTFAPTFGRPIVSGANLSRVQVRPVSGGYRVLALASGTYALAVKR